MSRAVRTRLDLALDEVKSWLRVENDADDLLIAGLIEASRDAADKWLNNEFDEVYKELVGRGDGSEVTFGLENSPAFRIVMVYIDDEELRGGYTLDVDHGTITFDEAPSTGVKIQVSYNAEVEIPFQVREAVLRRIAAYYEKRTAGVSAQNDQAGGVSWGDIEAEFRHSIAQWRKNPGF